MNPHAVKHMALNHACLPIPPPRQHWNQGGRIIGIAAR